MLFRNRSRREVDVPDLKNMVEERDKTIGKLNDQIHSLDMKLREKRFLLNEVKRVGSNEKVTRLTEVLVSRRRRKEIHQRLGLRVRYVLAQKGNISVYSAHLKGYASYVVRIQSQVCKAMHGMGIIEHQLDILQEISQFLIEELKDQMNGIVEDRSKIEVELMNDLMEVDSQRRVAEEGYQKHLKRLQQERSTLLALMEENGDDGVSSSSSTTDESSFDSALEIDEDLLSGIVYQHKEDGDQLERENQQQAVRIKELKAKLGELREKLER